MRSFIEQSKVEDGLRPGQEKKWMSRQTKVTFLSAIPFAYRKSIDYADGFLFNYEASSGCQAYNTPSGKDSFFVFNDLFNMINKRMDYHTKAYMLEAIKAKASIPIIKEHLKLGRQAVVFHNFNKGGGYNPFNLARGTLPNQTQAAYDSLISAMPNLLELDMNDLQSPIETFTKAFGDELRLFNGKVSKKDRAAGVKQFNEDNNGVNVVLVQADAGGAGISLHDTTGVHQRVLFNLGIHKTGVDRTTKDITRFYEFYQEVYLAHRTLSHYLKTGQQEEAEDFFQENKGILSLKQIGRK